MDSGLLLIGVDGGATEVKAHEVCCADLERLANIELGAAAASRYYPRVPDFNPLLVADQIAQRDSGRIQLSTAEELQGGLWVNAAADCIFEVARTAGAAGAAVLLISDELEELLTLADRLVVMYEGEIVGRFDDTDVDVEQLGLLMAGIVALVDLVTMRNRPREATE